MKLSIGATTDPGRRPNNEDYYAVVNADELGIPSDEVETLLIVADGMGGRNFGERASEAAVEVVKETLAEKLASSTLDIGGAIETALRRANDRVFALSQRDRESEGMGTTCVIALVTRGRLYLGHAGDSRAYVIHREQLEQLTEDHSFVAEQVRAGILSEEGARNSKFKNIITRAVGIDPLIEPDIAEYPLEAIDAILLCSDGLSNMLHDREIEQILLASPSAQIGAEILVRTAKSNGGSDNITAVVARFGDGAIKPEMELPEEKQPMEENANNDAPRLSRAPMLPIIALLLLLAGCLYMAGQLTQAGYVWQLSPPFLVKPVSAPHAPHDYTNLKYESAQKFYPYTVRPEPLVVGKDGTSIMVVSEAGEVLSLAADGTTVSRYTYDHVVGNIPSPAKIDNWHFAGDPQGNLYAADAEGDAIYKYAPSGLLLEKITAELDKPQSIGVDGDGDVYVVDGGTLKFVHAVSPAPAR